VTVLNADGSRTETVTDRSATARCLLSDHNWSLDGKTRTVDITAPVPEHSIRSRPWRRYDRRKRRPRCASSIRRLIERRDGHDDERQWLAKNDAAGHDRRARWQRQSALRPDRDGRDGAERRRQRDRDGNGHERNRTLLDETVTTTSANGLSVTAQQDTTGARDGSGNPIFDLTETDVTVLNADGSTTETVTDRSANGTLLGKTVTTTSADRRTQTVQIDSQGDGTFNEVQSRTVNANAA